MQIIAETVSDPKTVAREFRNRRFGPSMPARASRERADKAVELRSQGLSWREVASALGFSSVGAAQNAVKSAVKRQESRQP